MQRLPHWVINNRFPAVYDTESATVIEQTAKVYGAMQNLIDEYNKFVDDVNAEIERFENASNENMEGFKTCMTEIMSNFITASEMKIDEAIFYMKENIEATTTDVISNAIKNGSITIKEEYDPTSESLELVAEGSV